MTMLSTGVLLNISQHSPCLSATSRSTSSASAASACRGIAEILLNLGYRVTGSDARRSDAVERLERLGAKVFIGHEAAHVDGAHVVVYSSAVARDNVEVQAARQRGRSRSSRAPRCWPS